MKPRRRIACPVGLGPRQLVAITAGICDPWNGVEGVVLRSSNSAAPSVAKGHKRRFGRYGPMSALLPLATVVATCRGVANLLSIVPNIGRELPISPNPLPYHDIFAGDFLRRRTFSLEAEGTYLARRSGS